MTEEKRPDRSAADDDRDRREQRMMWIFSGAIALLILGGMGANVLYHRGSPPAVSDTDVSAQSRPAPAQ